MDICGVVFNGIDKIMQMIKFTETEAPTNLASIQRLEAWIGLSFPEVYQQHLLKYNGGTCDPCVFTFKEKRRTFFGLIEKYVTTDSVVGWFLAIHDGEFDSLEQSIYDYKIDEKRLPTALLPIANDPGGNLICISCGEKDYGYIYFWDHESEVDYTVADDSNYSNLSLIAKTLDDFFAGLKEYEEEEF